MFPTLGIKTRYAGVNRLRDVVKDVCSKAGLPGFFTQFIPKGVQQLLICIVVI